MKTPVKERRATSHMDAAGAIVVPATFRKKLGLAPGDPVTLTLDDDGLHVWSLRGRLRRVRALARKHVAEGTLVSEELIEDRRREAALD